MPRDTGVWQLRIELLGITPTIWRRLVIPAVIRLPKLHRVFQAAMGWMDSHLHEFVIGGKRYGAPDPEWQSEMPVIDERRVELGRIFDPHDRTFSYPYHFGDDWHHAVVVEDRHLKPLPGGPAISCVAGENACPPEDVGGLPGYAKFLDAIADPRHEEHEACLTWCGGRFNPMEFELESVNRKLARYCSIANISR